MGISLALAALIGRAIRSRPHVSLGARPPLPLPRAQVLVPAALGGALAALAVFSLAAPSLDPGVTRPDVATGRLLPGSLTVPLFAADGARDRPRSASLPAGSILARAAGALRAPFSVVAPAGAAPPTGRPAPGPSGRKRGGAGGSISLPGNDEPSAPTPPAQPPPVSEPTPPTPAPAEAPAPAAPTPAPAEAAQGDPDWQKTEVPRRGSEVPGRPVEVPPDDSETASTPSVPDGRGVTGQPVPGSSDGHE